MQILSDTTEYTWQQTLKFFLIGAAKACSYGLFAAGVAAWHNYRNYVDGPDWGLIRELLLSGVGLRLLGYWNEHKALLKMPPAWAIPAKFEPSQQEPPKP